MSELKSLTEFNRERHQAFTGDHNGPKRNGIACPECGAELYDSAPSMTLMSNPPRKNIACSECDYSGTRVA